MKRELNEETYTSVYARNARIKKMKAHPKKNTRPQSQTQKIADLS